MSAVLIEEQAELVLAAEECSDELFHLLHKFSPYEEKIIRALTAHGPVLVRGGRGSGKSTLMREANGRMRAEAEGPFSVYLSLRYLPLLRETGQQYERFFCELLSKAIQRELSAIGHEFPDVNNGGELQQQLVELATRLGRRIVLLFDDAAHLGRENASSEFFDIFRSISSRLVSCKAAIYPGVTNFGKRFDVYNDATVISIARDERVEGFDEFFFSVMSARYSKLPERFVGSLKPIDVAGFLGKAVLGNMRGFVFACNRLRELPGGIGLPELSKCLIDLCADYYWPLLEEVAPKLGRYEPLVDPSKKIAEVIFKLCGESGSSSIIVHRNFCQDFAKPLEILEYAGFISKREASRALKKGGRGPRFSVNLSNLLDVTPGRRITQVLFRQWLEYDREDFTEVNGNSAVFSEVEVPPLPDRTDLGIFDAAIEALAKSPAYPYGLTPRRIEILKGAGYDTVGKLAEAREEDLYQLPLIKEATLPRIRAVLAQAIWM